MEWFYKDILVTKTPIVSGITSWHQSKILSNMELFYLCSIYIVV